MITEYSPISDLAFALPLDHTYMNNAFLFILDCVSAKVNLKQLKTYLG